MGCVCTPNLCVVCVLQVWLFGEQKGNTALDLVLANSNRSQHEERSAAVVEYLSREIERVRFKRVADEQRAVMARKRRMRRTWTVEASSR